MRGHYRSINNGLRHKMQAMIREQLAIIDELIEDHEQQLEILRRDREGAVQAIADCGEYMEKIESGEEESYAKDD